MTLLLLWGDGTVDGTTTAGRRHCDAHADECETKL